MYVDGVWNYTYLNHNSCYHGLLKVSRNFFLFHFHKLLDICFTIHYHFNQKSKINTATFEEGRDEERLPACQPPRLRGTESKEWSLLKQARSFGSHENR